MDTTTPSRRLVPLPETQSKLGNLGRTTTYRLIADGELTLVKIGRRSFVTSDSLDSYIDRLATKADVKTEGA